MARVLLVSTDTPPSSCQTSITLHKTRSPNRIKNSKCKPLGFIVSKI